MSKLNDLKEKHRKEIEDFQKNCTHPEISDWEDVIIYPFGKTGFQHKKCEFCEKIIKERVICEKCGQWTEEYERGIGTKSRGNGAFFCPKCFIRTEEEKMEDEKEEQAVREFLKRETEKDFLINRKKKRWKNEQII